MENEKRQIAKNLYFQTNLTKTQIAGMLNVSRRSIGNWVKEGDWARLRESARHLPSLLAENCYHIIGHLTENYLSERRITNPVTTKEIDGLHKLTITATKLKNRNTLNESMEMFGFFMEMLKSRNSRLADEVMPYIDEYMSSRAGVYRQHVQPDTFNHLGRIPWTTDPDPEKLIDNREAFFNDPETIETYERWGIPFPSEEEISTIPQCKEPEPYTLQQRNEENAKAAEACNRKHLNTQPQPETTAVSNPTPEPQLQGAHSTSPRPASPELVEGERDGVRPHTKTYTFDEIEKLIEEANTYLAGKSPQDEEKDTGGKQMGTFCEEITDKNMIK